MTKHVVASARDLPPGSRKLVTLMGREIAIFNIGGELFGLFNRCPHQGGSLCQGTMTSLLESSEPGHYRFSREGEILRCPWHGWEFDIRTGQSYCSPDRIRVKSCTVDVEAGQKIVAGPYSAETIPVAVEADYVVVEL